MYNENIAVEINNLGKMYKLYKNPKDKIKDAFGLNFYKKDYYQEFWALRDVNITIPKGERVGLIGHNGAGKTTIIKLLLRLYDPTSGVILYNGRDIREYNLKAYRELFATTFQDFQMFGMTIKENVLMGRHYENEHQRVITALKKAGVYEKVTTLKDGFHTMMTKEFDAE